MPLLLASYLFSNGCHALNFKRKAQEWKTLAARMAYEPFEATKRNIVYCILVVKLPRQDPTSMILPSVFWITQLAEDGCWKTDDAYREDIIRETAAIMVCV